MKDCKETATLNISEPLLLEEQNVASRQRALSALENLPSLETKGEDSIEVLRRIRKQRDFDIASRH